MPLIDRLHRVALRLSLLRAAVVFMGLVCVAILLAAILLARPGEWDSWIMPSFVGLLWSISAYFFMITFHSIPAPADASLPFLARAKQRLVRSGYWLIGLAFLGATLAVLLATYRILALWLGKYGG